MKSKVVLTFAIIILAIYITIFYLFTKSDTTTKIENEKNKLAEEFNVTSSINSYNKYSVKSINQEELANLYFNDFKNLIVNYPDEAYSLVTNKEKLTKERFLEYRDELINFYYGYNLESYSSYNESEKGTNVFRIIDSADNVFTFKIYYIMNYDVSIDLNN